MLSGKIKTVVLLSAMLMAIVSGCGKSGDDAKSTDGKERLKVVTTIGMLADILENVGGDKLSVTGLMGPGVDPHLYKASAGDVDKMSSADLIIYNGLHLEGAMTEVFAKMHGKVTTVAVAEVLDDSLLLAHQDYVGAHDPHVWFDVQLWKAVANKATEVLTDTDPANADHFQANLARYQTKLDELHAYVISQAERVEKEKRVLITAHDAFSYFGRAYGFEVRGLQGISTASEAGTADIQQLAEFLADRKIPAIFVESSVPKRNIEAVQAAVEARGFAISIGGELFSDAMGDGGTPEGTYFGMVKHNIDTIVGALLGESKQEH